MTFLNKQDKGFEVLSASDRGRPISLINGTFVAVHSVPLGQTDALVFHVVHDGSTDLDFTYRFTDTVFTDDITIESKKEDGVGGATFTIESDLTNTTDILIRQNDAGISAVVIGSVISDEI